MAAKRITLSSLGGGELELLVEREIRKLCENIADPSIKTDATRKITINLAVKPDKKGQVADIVYSVKTMLPGPDASKTTAYIAMEPGSQEIALFGMDIRQNELFAEPAVTEIRPISKPEVVPSSKSAAYAPPLAQNN